MKKNPTADEMSDTIYKLQKRVENYSTEAVRCTRREADRINIEIPGVSDANAILEELGKPGSLIFTGYETHVRPFLNRLTRGGFRTRRVISKSRTVKERQYVVSLTLTEEGTKANSLTQLEANYRQDSIAIIYDNQIYCVTRWSVQAQLRTASARSTGMSRL
ncbi:MAG: hypothetical protein ACLUL2_02350 [Blautia sp.]